MATSQELLRLAGQKSLEVNKLYEQIGETDPTAEQRKSVIDLNKEIEELEVKASEALEWESGRKSSADRAAEYNRPVRTIGHGDGNTGNVNGTTSQTAQGSEQNAGGSKGAHRASDEFLNSPQFKSWMESVAPAGHIAEKQRIQSPPIAVKALITGLSDTSAGAMVQTDYKPFVGLPFRPLTIRDIITIGQTGSDLIEYAQFTSFTNAAAAVAEATTTSNGTKPESAMVLAKVTASVKTIAHWIPATKRSLADAGQIRTLIDAFLRYGLEEELEDQIIAGDGTGENFTGILNFSGTTAQAWDTDILTTTRKARTKVRVTGRATPNAYVLHPNDWQTLDLLQDNEARYYFGGPMVLGTPRLWGLPVVESEAMTEGTGVVGDFKQVVLWDREQASITMSDSHENYFIKNLVAILAEMRAAMGILRPAALVEMDLTA